MTPVEIQAMAKGLAQGQAVWYVLSACIGGCITGFGAYFAEKGKNRATKEDIREITRTVKEVEAGFNEKLADLQAHHQLRMVAAERRLHTHQEAYTYWLHMFMACLNQDETRDRIKECHVWFSANCLFLGVKSRSAFWQAYVAAGAFQELKTKEIVDEKEYWAVWEKLESAGNVFLEEVDLPPLSDETRRVIAGSAAPT